MIELHLEWWNVLSSRRYVSSYWLGLAETDCVLTCETFCHCHINKCDWPLILETSAVCCVFFSRFSWLHARFPVFEVCYQLCSWVWQIAKKDSICSWVHFAVNKRIYWKHAGDCLVSSQDFSVWHIHGVTFHNRQKEQPFNLWAAAKLKIWACSGEIEFVLIISDPKPPSSTVVGVVVMVGRCERSRNKQKDSPRIKKRTTWRLWSQCQLAPPSYRWYFYARLSNSVTSVAPAFFL